MILCTFICNATLARSLLNWLVEFIARGSKVFSVTSDIQAGTVLKTPAPKQSRQDASQLSDSFSALVDAATPPDPSTSSLPTSATSASRASSSASSPSREVSRSTDIDRANKAGAQDNADGSSAPADRSSKPGSDATADKSAKAGTDTADAATGKTGDNKDSDPSSADATAAAQAAVDQAAATAVPVAVAIPTEITLANPATAATPDGDAASAATAPAVPVAGTAGVGANGTADATAGLMAAAAKSANPAKTSDEAAATQAGSGATTTASGDAAASPDQTFTAALDAAVPGGTKSAGKPGTAAKTGLTTGEAGITSDQGGLTTQGTHQPNQTGGAQQPAIAAKPDNGETAPTAKGDGNAPAPSAHERGAAQAGTQSNLPASDPTAQAASALQPQLTTPATAANPITAANLTATAATAAAVPLHGLAVEIAASALNGKSRFEIRLDPAELGRIDVRIDVDRNGQVTSHLRVEKPETLAMLQQTAPQLQQALQDAGLKSNNSGLQFSLRDQNSSGQNGGDNQQNANAQRLIVTEDETVPAQLAGRSYGRMFSAQGGVDIRV